MFVLLKIFFFNPEANLSRKNLSAANFLLLFLIDFIAVVFVLVLEVIFFGFNTNSFVRNFDRINQDIILIIVLGLVVFPILEEFLHRYYLNYRTINLLVSALLLLLYCLSVYDNQNPILNAIHFSGFLFILVMLILKKWYYYMNLKLLIWGSILFFGLFHLSTYERDVYASHYFVVPVLLMPQFIGGFFLAFIRTQYRFFYCILYHSFFNLVLLTIGLITYHLSEFYS